MPLSSQLAMLSTQRPAGERAKRSKLAKEMVTRVQLTPATGLASPRTMNVNGKECLIDRTHPGRERMYLSQWAKGHEIRMTLGNTVATGIINSTGATNSFQWAWKSSSGEIRSQRRRCGATPTYGARTAPRGCSARTWGQR